MESYLLELITIRNNLKECLKMAAGVSQVELVKDITEELDAVDIIEKNKEDFAKFIGGTSAEKFKKNKKNQEFINVFNNVVVRKN